MDTIRALLHEVIKKLEADIVLLQETRSRPAAKAEWAKKWSPCDAIYNSTT